MKLTLLHDSALATGVFGLALAPDGGRAFAACADGRVIGIDPQSGEQRAVFDLVWPNGLQEALSQPVAVLLNEDAATIRLAGEAGFRCFTEGKSFKRYVMAEVLGETARA